MNQPLSAGRPLVWTALRPVHGDCDKLRRALAKLAEDQPGFEVDEEVDAQIIIRATGELQVEMICERLAREHHLCVARGDPKVIYLETIRETSAAEGNYITQSGGRGHYAHVMIRIDPNPGRGYEFVDDRREEAIPGKYVQPVDHGVQYALREGVVAGCEMVDVKVTLCDGSYHEGDSDDAAFESAGFMAVKEALPQASPVLLEPVMYLELIVPQEFCGSIIGDLTSRRGRIEAMENRAGNQAIQAVVPLAEILGYATQLRSITLGRANYSARFATYQQAPGLPPIEDDGIGVTANKPWKPKPKRGAKAAEWPYSAPDC
jgi:elongation factor G